MGFHANFAKRKSKMKNVRVVQKMRPKPGVTIPIVLRF
jgi:hypothetical protein